ncbi:MAG: hypothetical protein GY953_08355, partial [bacterium]|nr:hypothetical protein [bacterium]
EQARRRWEEQAQRATTESRPPIQRAPATPEPEEPAIPSEPEPELVKVEGSLQSVDCLGDRVRLNLFVNGQRVKLAIYDPTSIIVKGTGGVEAELDCNQRKLIPVTIEFESKKDPELGTSGVVRVIAFE